MMIKFKQLQKFLRTYSVELNNKIYSIDDIVVYDNEGIICKRSFMDCIKGEVFHLNIENLSRRLKENFSKKEAYILKSKETYNYDNEYNLYIHRDLIELSEPIYTKNKFGYIEVSYTTRCGINFDNMLAYRYDEEILSVKKEICQISESIQLGNDVNVIISKIEQLECIKNKLLEAQKKADDFTVEDYLKMMEK